MKAVTVDQNGFNMSERINKIEGSSGGAELPADVDLMLRAHAETRCLSREVIPVLRQIETGNGLPQEQYGAAMAYLEVTWLAARRCAQESDAAHRQLCALPSDETGTRADRDELHGGACRYYESVKDLRGVVQRRVSMLLDACGHIALRPRERSHHAGR
ncbi:MAG TPA: hypothetical protein VGP17_12490 [Solirubrobacteraceae bacterium]|jgi:hypothetical protein|nr:hypothetical protein [Solirubrobacteraceae bacterium]